MYKNYRKEPKSPDINEKTHQPMSEYNTKQCLTEHMREIQQEKKRFPTEKEFDSLITRTIAKMNNVWLEYYTEYAGYCGSTINKFDFPTPFEVCEQFTNFLTRNRAPDCPKRISEKAPITYGDYKRFKFGPNENYYNDVQGWNDQVAELHVKSKNSRRDGDGNFQSRGSYRGDSRRGGNFRAARCENNWNNRNNFHHKKQSQMVVESGWSDNDSDENGEKSVETENKNRAQSPIDNNNNNNSNQECFVSKEDEWDD